MKGNHPVPGRRVRTFHGCPFCGGHIPSLGYNARGEPRIYRPHPGLRCMCGYADDPAVLAGVAAELALARAREAARRAGFAQLELLGVAELEGTAPADSESSVSRPPSPPETEPRC